jgi:hypothetical protein
MYLMKDKDRKKIKPVYVINIFKLGLILLIVGLAFWGGRSVEETVNQLLAVPSPTPTPDTRAEVGEMVQIDDLEMTVVDAWRILRPGPGDDLEIITVKFHGTYPCYDPENVATCTFYRNNFQLINVQGEVQQRSDPPRKFIRGMKIIQLAPSRMLIPLTTETGQIYFLLDKESEEFTLTYSSAVSDKEVKFILQPKIYTGEDATRNLTTTPQPRYGVVEEESDN